MVTNTRDRGGGGSGDRNEHIGIPGSMGGGGCIKCTGSMLSRSFGKHSNKGSNRCSVKFTSLVFAFMTKKED